MKFSKRRRRGIRGFFIEFVLLTTIIVVVVEQRGHRKLKYLKGIIAICEIGSSFLLLLLFGSIKKINIFSLLFLKEEKFQQKNIFSQIRVAFQNFSGCYYIFDYYIVFMGFFLILYIFLLLWLRDHFFLFQVRKQNERESE